MRLITFASAMLVALSTSAAMAGDVEKAKTEMALHASASAHPFMLSDEELDTVTAGGTVISVDGQAVAGIDASLVEILQGTLLCPTRCFQIFIPPDGETQVRFNVSR